MKVFFGKPMYVTGNKWFVKIFIDTKTRVPKLAVFKNNLDENHQIIGK